MAIPTVGLRLNPHIASAGLNIDSTSEFRVPDEAPWLLQKPRVRLDLTRLKQSDTNNLEYKQNRIEMFYLTMHSTHFIYSYMASDIWLRTILIVRKQTRCRHIGYSYQLTARVLLYAPSHRQDSTYHGLCYTSCETLAGMRNSSMGPPHEGLIR